MSNIYKANAITYDYENVRVIETNDLELERIKALKINIIQNQRKENQENNELIEQEVTDITDSLFESGIEAMKISSVTYAGPSPEELIEEANKEIAIMKEKARDEISTMEQNAMEKGREQGYQEGKEQANQQMLEEKAKNKLLFNQHQEEVKLYYEKKMQEIEPLLIDTLSDIYQHIFNVELKTKKELITYLISNTLRQIEGGRDFLVHVSREDYPLVISKKEELEDGLIENARVEYIEDATLNQSDCYVEAEGGIFDCSLTTQLEELKTQLKLLSYTK